MTDQTKAPERIFARPNGDWNSFGFWNDEAMAGSVPFTRADLAAEQVKQAYERGLEDAARVADVKPRRGGRPLSGPHHGGIRAGRAEAARLIRAALGQDGNVR